MSICINCNFAAWGLIFPVQDYLIYIRAESHLLIILTVNCVNTISPLNSFPGGCHCQTLSSIILLPHTSTDNTDSTLV